MYGQKEIVSCMVIVTLVAILNYYKSIIKRDKEIQNNRRQFLEKQKLEEQLLQAEQAAFNHAIFLRKMLEYSDRCYDVHALIYRPRDYDVEEQTLSNVNATESNYTDDKASEGNLHLTAKKEFVILKGKENINGKGTDKTDSSSIVYVLVAILLGSLIKAALDLTKHYKKVHFHQYFK